MEPEARKRRIIDLTARGRALSTSVDQGRIVLKPFRKPRDAAELPPAIAVRSKLPKVPPRVLPRVLPRRTLRGLIGEAYRRAKARGTTTLPHGAVQFRPSAMQRLKGQWKKRGKRI